MKTTTKIIIGALIAACLAETAMSASANDAKAWMRPENLRWACYQWENKVHFRRMGGPHVPFWCNSTFLDDYFERLYCKETLQKFKDIGVTCIATSFYKGYGLETEKEEMARQAGRRNGSGSCLQPASVYPAPVLRRHPPGTAADPDMRTRP